MRIAHLLAAPLAFLLVASPVHAQAPQFQAEADIDTPDGDRSRYVGSDPSRGDSNDGGRDAFDGYGTVTNLRGLTLSRQSEFFDSLNLFRFLDTFTNTTSRRVSTTINFFGNLGSDSDTFEVLSEDGLIVSCQFREGSCVGDPFGNDPIIAHVFSNKGVGLASLGSDEDADAYNALFRLVLNPGQSASFLNFAFLASEEDGTSLADIDLAIARGRELQLNPFAGGLTNAQRAQIVNFDVAQIAAVPEPATWAMMIAGFGLIGGSMRRRAITKPVAAIA